MEKSTFNGQKFPGPENISRTMTVNGITVLSIGNFHTSSVNITGLLEGGSVQDPVNKLGQAHFTTSMLTRGTKSRSFSAYHQELESRGASLGFSCGTRYTWFRGQSLAEDLEILLDLASDSLMNATFEEQYVERLRNQLIAGLAIRDQDTAEVASMLLDRFLFTDHPYGHPVDGTAETIESISRQDLIDFYKDNYSPVGMIIAAAGAVETDRVIQLVEKKFAGWDKKLVGKTSIPPLPPPPSKILRKHKQLEEKSQLDLVMGTYGPSRTSWDYLPVFLGNNILGEFGLMGRIGESVRTRAGLAYYASSSINAWTDGGTWEFTAGLNPENVDKTVQLIRDEIKRFVDAPVTPEELGDSQSHLTGRLPLSLETNAGLANGMLNIERFQLGLDYYQRYADLIFGISAEEILETSRKYLHPDQLVIASAGTGKDML